MGPVPSAGPQARSGLKENLPSSRKCTSVCTPVSVDNSHSDEERTAKSFRGAACPLALLVKLLAVVRI